MIGDIIFTVRTIDDENYLLCDGQPFDINKYPELDKITINGRTPYCSLMRPTKMYIVAKENLN
jgi:hypothetical protein